MLLLTLGLSLAGLPALGIDLGCNGTADTNYDAIVAQPFFSRFITPEVAKIAPKARTLINRASGDEKPTELLKLRISRFLNPEESDAERLTVIRGIFESLDNLSRFSHDEAVPLRTLMKQNLNSIGLITPASSNQIPQPYSSNSTPLAMDAGLYQIVTEVFLQELSITPSERRGLLSYQSLLTELQFTATTPFESKVLQIQKFARRCDELRNFNLLRPGELMSEIRDQSKQIENGLLKIFTATNQAILESLNKLHADWFEANASAKARRIKAVTAALNNALPRAALLFQDNSNSFWRSVQAYETAMQEAVRGNFPREMIPYHYAFNDVAVDYASYQKLQEHFEFYDNLIPEDFFTKVNENIPARVLKRFRVKKDRT